MTYYLDKTLAYIKPVVDYIPSIQVSFPKRKHLPISTENSIIQRDILPMTSPFIRFAGLSGAAAIVLAAIGSHSLMKEGSNITEANKRTFETASKYHLIHSVALLLSPQARFPLVTGGLFGVGMILFCGSCYHIAMTNDRTLAPLTPYGGFCLIFGWLSFLF
uniref:Transmembrane protein 256 (inferred by orthology to a zebrafish protein) n=1 Tax=Strongyloides venezuelensis TaxID=75913 RepID=A0A0K0F677_STRVS